MKNYLLQSLCMYELMKETKLSVKIEGIDSSIYSKNIIFPRVEEKMEEKA